MAERRAWVLLLLAAYACGGPTEIEPLDASLPPSVIVISIDTLRADHTGFGGYERDTTPFLDRFAGECVQYDRAYTTMSWTLVANMSLLTGLYPEQHRVWDGKTALPPTIPTLAERFRDAGYHTLGFHAPGWTDARFGYDRGFDSYIAHTSAEEAGRHVREALAKRPADQPLFLFIQLFDVHNSAHFEGDGAWSIYAPPAAYADLFLEGARARVEESDPVAIWLDPGATPGPEVHEAIVALYDGGVRYVDDQLKEWFDEWRTLGLLDRSYTIVTSDHGEGLGQREGYSYRGHGELFEEGLRIPLLLRYPGGEYGGTRRSQPVSLVDIAPSVLRWTGQAVDGSLPGKLLEEPREAGEPIFMGDESREAILLGRWKVIQMRGREAGTVYDLESDPAELRSLRTLGGAVDYREIAGTVREIAAQTRSTWFLPSEPNPLAEPADPEILQGLGYGDDH